MEEVRAGSKFGITFALDMIQGVGVMRLEMMRVLSAHRSATDQGGTQHRNRYSSWFDMAGFLPALYLNAGAFPSHAIIHCAHASFLWYTQSHSGGRRGGRGGHWNHHSGGGRYPGSGGHHGGRSGGGAWRFREERREERRW